jgi:phosphoglycerate kinase
MLAIVGGSKVSTKLSVLKNLVNRVDGLILGGGILNTFIAAQGFNIGKSLYEPDFVDEAKVILDEIKNRQIFFPTIDDVICAKEFDVNAHAELKKIDDLESDDMIFDLGPKTLKNITDHLSKVSTIMWNGPLGVFEFEQFSSGTEALSRAIADGEAFSLAGGGDTIAAIEKYKVCRKISYISTAGGAFLEFAEGKKLPAIEMLEQ